MVRKVPLVLCWRMYNGPASRVVLTKGSSTGLACAILTNFVSMS